MRVGSYSPWGAVDHVTERCAGIWSVSTPSHGGFKLDDYHNSLVHPAWRRDGGWYEEDCDWAIVALTFPAYFTPAEVECADATARGWEPDGYAAALNRVVPAEDSYVLRKRAFAAAHADDYVVYSAYGKPDGVYVHARRARDSAEIQRVVPQTVYRAGQGDFGFVLDPDAYPSFEEASK